MTWTAFHRRGEVLRTVVETADQRVDGELPLDVPGVAETFADAPTCSAPSSCGGTPASPAGSSASSCPSPWTSRRRS